MKKILLAVFLACCFCGNAQEAKIRGNAPYLPNQTLSLLTYEDYLTLTPAKRIDQQTDENGSFAFNLKISSTQFIYLKYKNVRVGFYVQPDRTYRLKILKLDSIARQNLAAEVEAEAIFQNYDSLELNQLIGKYNKKLDKFYEENTRMIALKAIKPLYQKISDFKKQALKDFAYAADPYFKSYMKYSFASLDEMVFTPRGKMMADYFSGPVLYTNYDYMQFLDAHFRNQLEQLGVSNKGEAVFGDINDRHDYKLLSRSVLKADSMLGNDTLRELLIIKGLGELYYKPRMKKYSVELVLEQIIKNPLNDRNKLIAQNTLARLTNLQVNSKAPDFIANNMEGAAVRLSDFRNKVIYLSFWSTNSVSSMEELLAIKKMHDKYGDFVTFISICTDEEPAAAKAFVKKNKLDWVLLQAAGSRVTEQYGIRAVPAFFLIDKDGFFTKSPAPAPSQDIEDTFRDLSQKKEKKSKVGEKD